MRVYSQPSNKVIPDKGETFETEQITGATYPPFSWRRISTSYDAEAGTATIGIQHSFDNFNSVALIRLYTFECTEEWSVEDNYAKILTLSPYQDSVLVT